MFGFFSNSHKRPNYLDRKLTLFSNNLDCLASYFSEKLRRHILTIIFDQTKKLNKYQVNITIDDGNNFGFVSIRC